MRPSLLACSLGMIRLHTMNEMPFLFLDGTFSQHLPLPWDRCHGTVLEPPKLDILLQCDVLPAQGLVWPVSFMTAISTVLGPTMAWLLITWMGWGLRGAAAAYMAGERVCLLCAWVRHKLHAVDLPPLAIHATS